VKIALPMEESIQKARSSEGYERTELKTRHYQEFAIADSACEPGLGSRR
jgi:hypothetical protein